MAKANTQPETEVRQRRVNRGSRRRIENAKTNFNKAFEGFVREIDIQFFEADEKGNRTGDWSMIKELRELKQAIFGRIDEAMGDNLAKNADRIAERRAEAPVDPKSEAERQGKRQGNAKAVASKEPGPGKGTKAEDPSKNE
jgi:hypothetical protein